MKDAEQIDVIDLRRRSEQVLQRMVAVCEAMTSQQVTTVPLLLKNSDGTICCMASHDTIANIFEVIRGAAAASDEDLQALPDNEVVSLWSCVEVAENLPDQFLRNIQTPSNN